MQGSRDFRETLRFYMIDCRTSLGKLIDILIICLNLMVCALLVVETYTVSETMKQILWKLEVSIVLFFMLEYILRLYAAKSRLRQVVDIYSMIDLIAILPTLAMLIFPFFGIVPNFGILKIIRGFRVFRIFRFLRFTADTDFFFGSISVHMLKVIRLLFTIMMIFFISSGLFYYVENGLNPNVNNFGDAFYFTVVALTTVGFGDIIPLSDAGKWVTVLMIFSGIIFIPWQISQIVREWMYMANKKDVICPGCGLQYHDPDASHCKSCGHVIYQEYDGE